MSTSYAVRDSALTEIQQRQFVVPVVVAEPTSTVDASSEVSLDRTVWFAATRFAWMLLAAAGVLALLTVMALVALVVMTGAAAALGLLAFGMSGG